ncbi:MAG: patatin-like phospholipase family protein [Magnetococcales bacterium]|nr:patatin-like phospholipase family protein [Magnetococcales bacterium]MBF0322247.1 patatin-like phospholipase family protein [Magnetococcales bacterium]
MPTIADRIRVKSWVVLWILILPGCAGKNFEEEIYNKGLSLMSENYFSEKNLREKFGAELRDGQLPKLGVGLAGGGSKAGSFAMGVLQGLDETRILQHADILSTVSGGGYAGLWYYSRLLEADQEGMKEDTLMTKYFRDCLPCAYRTLRINASNKIEEQPEGEIKVCPDDDIFLDNISRADQDPYRYQNHLRGFQDILAYDSDIPFDMKHSGQDRFSGYIAKSIFLKTAAAIIPNLLANVLFDWQMALSPSAKAYAKGIAHTYGVTPRICSANTATSHQNETVCPHVRPIQEIRSVENLDFTQLRALYKKEQPYKAPLWVINATVGEGRSGLDVTNPKHPELNVMEMTPFGYYSGIYGKKEYSVRDEDFSVLKGVAASAAFFDSQEKVLEFPARNIVNLFQKALTLDWGIPIPNQSRNISDSTREWHNLLPWPLYYGHHFTAGSNPVYLRMADGGNTEALGAYALIRRGVKTIILSDHSFDGHGRMGDVCRLRQVLEEKGLSLRFPGLAGLPDLCGHSGRAPTTEAEKNFVRSTPQVPGEERTGYDIHNWYYPVLVGCITENDGRESLYDQRATDRGAMCSPPQNHPGAYHARVILLKPALSRGMLLNGQLEKWQDVFRPLQSCTERISPDEQGDRDLSACLAQAGHQLRCRSFSHGEGLDRTKNFGPDWQNQQELPCEALGYVLTHVEEKPGKGLCLQFPQHSTEAMTANSSSFRYGAYRDLGRHLARMVRYFFKEGHDRVLDESFFNEELHRQANVPMRHIPNHDGFQCFGEDKDRG